MTDLLPTGWVTTTLGEICVAKVSQAPPTTSPVPYIDISAIDRTTKQIVETKLVSDGDAPTRARQWVQARDVLVSMTRPNLNAVAQVHPDLDGAVASTGFDVLRPVGVLPEWVFYRVRSNEFVADVCEGLQGVVYPAIRPHDVRRHRLPLPPEGEQRRIVEAIESYLTRLDDVVATLERVQRNLKRYRASVLKAAVEGRLVPTEAELARAERRDYEPASTLLDRILTERRHRWEEAELAKMQAKGKPPKNDNWKAKYRPHVGAETDDVPLLPEGWCWTSVDALSWEGGYGTSQKCHANATGPPVLRIPNVQDESLNFDGLKFATKADDLPPDGVLVPGDFIFIRTNGSKSLIGRGAVVVNPLPREYYFASYLIRLRLALNSTTAKWFALAWHVPVVRDQLLRDAASSAGQHNVSLSAARSYLVPLPPLAEQERILTEVERLLSIADSANSSVGPGVVRAASLRQSILKWAFEGRLVDQDSSDEPASRLLERIRAERESSEEQPRLRRSKTKAKAKASKA